MEVKMSLDMQKAYDTAGIHLSEWAIKSKYKIPEDFTFLKMRQANFAFFELCFRYKNQVFAVLLDIKHNNSSIFENSRKREENFIEFCKENNLIPCLFPLNLSFDKENGEHGYGTYITGDHISSQTFAPYNTDNWNLIHAVTKENINPSEWTTDASIPMSRYEQYNFATEIAKQIVEKWYGSIVEWNDVLPGNSPQIVYLEKDYTDSKAWCCVVVVDKPIEDMTDEDIVEVTEHHQVSNPIFNRNGIFILFHIRNTNRANLRHVYEYKVKEIDNSVHK